MKFKKLDLIGFKSFFEKTTIIIEKGLTGIVGPNGCGKSNVVEAIRWCMGETSAKSMRGSGMEDVIFSGTANKTAKNIAEVSLVLDNSDKDGPLQFKELDTINVKRRIEKDKGSRYFINDKEMRARDVQTLFADLSTGAHSPSMISQGRIGALVTAKPTDTPYASSVRRFFLLGLSFSGLVMTTGGIVNLLHWILVSIRPEDEIGDFGDLDTN